MKRNQLAYLTIASLACTATTHAATVIYSQAFTGAATTAVGTAPTVRPGSEVWQRLTGSGANANPFNLNGATTTGAGGGIFLAFTPTVGLIYTLSASIDRTSSNSAWITVGFNDNLSGDSFTTSGLGTVLIRGDAQPTDGNAFNGLGTTGALADFNFNNDGVNNVEIILNATNANSALWTMEYKVGGTSVGGPTTGPGTYGNISFVGFSHSNTTGTISNFSLTSVPEPSAALLGGLGLLALLRRRR